jgi:hypothetical protein
VGPSLESCKVETSEIGAVESRRQHICGAAAGPDWHEALRVSVSDLCEQRTVCYHWCCPWAMRCVAESVRRVHSTQVCLIGVFHCRSIMVAWRRSYP